MNSKSLILLRAMFMSTSRINALKHTTDKKIRKKHIGAIVGAAVLAVYGAVMVGLIAGVMAGFGFKEAVPGMVASVITIMSLVFTLLKSNGYLYGFKEYDMNNRFFNMDLAGGAMLDIGVYALSIIRSFMNEKPEEIVSQWLPSPTGSDEQATILLKNSSGQMATAALSMHSKQPKRAMISMEKAYIEIMEYPRACKAVIVDAETGERKELEYGDTSKALYYEMVEMEEAVRTGDASIMRINESRDVMNIMTRIRKDWGMRYPGEEW